MAIVGIRFPKLFLINGLSTSTKLRAYATARMKEISQGGESTPSVYPFAMDTSGFKPVVGQCTGDICEGLTERFELPSLTPFSFTTIQ